ncbi:hypothetical protein [Planobispora takensis]|uniref:Uncharacterized protein n=1 Tax=Planobispora takensis TaxID=1367882 RepID=A0A8J3SYG6_9ACTN|nr:hypothetical protein [Planobispora takensis]GII02984.1 hypothetical protein Pta02_49920 [Planobispora takensis]
MSPPSPPPPASPPLTRAFSAYGLPAHTLRIFASCGLSLVLWFSAGRTIRWALMWAATEVAHGDYRQVRLIVVMLLYTLIVLNELVVMVGMLHSVRGALREIQMRRTGEETDESLFGALNRATLIFATIYLAWSFHAEDARELVALDNIKQIIEHGIVAGATRDDFGTLLTGMEVWISAAIAVAAYALKTLFAWWHTNGKGKASGMLAAFFELAFAFYGLNAIFTVTSARSEWLKDRAVVATFEGWIESAEKTIPVWKPFWEGVSTVWPLLVDALIEPLTWLTVAALVYGAFAEDTRAVVRGTRLEGVADRMDTRTHSLTRSTMTRTTTGFQERWVPPANAFRLVTRGGWALFGMFCLCYVALHVGMEYADRAFRTSVGTDFPHFWLLFGHPVDFVRNLIVGVLTVCLLAATFDIASAHSREAGETDEEGEASTA